MFLILRSAVCIGLVAAALPGRPAADMRDLGDLVQAAGPAATVTLARYCDANPTRCPLPFGAAAADPRPAADRPSRLLRNVPPAPAPRAATVLPRLATAALRRGA